MKALTVVPRRAGSSAVRDVPDPVAGDGEAMVEETTVVERAFKPERRALLERIGARYAATSQTPLASLGPADIAFEATGSSAVAFGAIELLGPNGATARVPLADAAGAITHDPSQIKTVVEIRGAP